MREKKFISRNEAKIFLGVSLVTLDYLLKKHKVIKHKKGNRVYIDKKNFLKKIPLDNMSKKEEKIKQRFDVVRDGYKKCPCCKKRFEYTIDNFYQGKGRKDGFKPYCRPCGRYKKYIGDIKNPNRVIYPGMIYVLECDGFYKIGCTRSRSIKNLEIRLRTIRVGNPHEVNLFGYKNVLDSYRVENLLHIEYANRVVRGERYSITKEEANEIIEKISCN